MRHGHRHEDYDDADHKGQGQVQEDHYEEARILYASVMIEVTLALLDRSGFVWNFLREK